MLAAVLQSRVAATSSLHSYGMLRDEVASDAGRDRWGWSRHTLRVKYGAKTCGAGDDGHIFVVTCLCRRGERSILHHIVQVRPSQKPERSGRALPVGDLEDILICHSLKR